MLEHYLISFLHLIFNILVFLCMCICAPPLCWWFRGKKKLVDPLGLELQTVVNCYVYTRSWTQVPRKSCLYFWLLTSLHPPILFYVYGCYDCLFGYAPHAFSANGCHKKASDPLIWRYKWLLSDMWVLGIEFSSSERADSTHNHCAIYPVPVFFFTQILSF